MQVQSQVILFACSRCFSRHPFEELSSGQQLCKQCRSSHTISKCTYCRSEFQQSSKSSSNATICPKCEHNVQKHGKPTACEYCNIIAAFGSSKCQRCTHSELKYGPAITCDQCRQRCAFDRHDESKKIDGKIMCWLCTLSYKRAVARARHGDVEHLHQLGQKRPSSIDRPMIDMKRHLSSIRPDAKRANVPSSTMRSRSSTTSGDAAGGSAVTATSVGDHTSSEHVVAMTQLKEQIASLNKKLAAKDRELLAKDKMMTELKSKNFISENELRNKMKDSEKYYETKIDVLNKKVAGLLKEVAQLSKGTKRGATATVSTSSANGNGSAVVSTAVSSSSKESSSSGTDSPNNN